MTAEQGEQHARGGRCTENRKPPFGCVLFKAERPLRFVIPAPNARQDLVILAAPDELHSGDQRSVELAHPLATEFFELFQASLALADELGDVYAPSLGLELLEALCAVAQEARLHRLGSSP